MESGGAGVKARVPKKVVNAADISENGSQAMAW